MNETQAKDIMQKARGVFTKKTNNKIYDQSPAAFIPFDKVQATIEAQKTLLDFAFTDERAAELKKMIKRNETNLANRNLRANNPRGGTPYKRGETMYTRGGDALGNCAEHSAVAAYLAIKDYAAEATGKTYLLSVGAPGDHVFCAVGLDAKPTWKTAQEMVDDFSNPFVMIIDPWLNFVCFAGAYKTAAEAKLQKWLRAGKRIYWEGKTSTQPGWYQPGGDYAIAFWSSPLGSEKAD